MKYWFYVIDKMNMLNHHNFYIISATNSSPWKTSAFISFKQEWWNYCFKLVKHHSLSFQQPFHLFSWGNLFSLKYNFFYFHWSSRKISKIFFANKSFAKGVSWYNSHNARKPFFQFSSVWLVQYLWILFLQEGFSM